MPTNFSCGCSLIKSTCLTKRKKRGAGEYIFVLVFISPSETRKKYEGGELMIARSQEKKNPETVT